MDVKITDNSGLFKSAMSKAKEAALKAIGLQAEGYAKLEITKKHAIDTGLLRNSITHGLSGQSPAISSYKADKGDGHGSYSGTLPKGDGSSVYIGTNVEYATYIEMGTSRMDPRPFIKPAAIQHSDEYKAIALNELRKA